jgi:hypothetical protein
MSPSDLARVEHALPRRVRLVAPLLVDHPAACERVARALAAGGAFARVTVRPLTGSVLLEDDEACLDPGALVERLRALVETEHDEAGRLLGAVGTGDHPSPTRVARAVVRAASGINADVGARFDHRVDLGTLLPVFFAVAGVAELGVSGKMPVPSWFNLLWWSMRAFMTFNLRAVEEEVQDGPGHDRELGEIMGAL